MIYTFKICDLLCPFGFCDYLQKLLASNETFETIELAEIGAGRSRSRIFVCRLRLGLSNAEAGKSAAGL